MSTLNIRDTDETALWAAKRNGETVWLGNTPPTGTVHFVGTFDTVTRNAVTIYTSVDRETGLHYDVATGTATPFAAYDGYLMAERIFHFTAYTFLLLLCLWTLKRFLMWRSPS